MRNAGRKEPAPPLLALNSHASCSAMSPGKPVTSRSPMLLPHCPSAALHGFALLKDKQVGAAYGSHFLLELVQEEVAEHLQVSHGVPGSKGMTGVVADSMEPTFFSLPKKSWIIKLTWIECKA